MKKILAIMMCLMLLTTLGFAETTEPEQEDPYKEIIEQIIDSSVSIFSINRRGMGRCSGVVIKEDKKTMYILTAKHCIGACEEMYVENVPVDYVVTPTDDDLALLILKRKLKAKKVARIAKKDPEHLDIALHVGFPDGNLYGSVGRIRIQAQDWTFVSLKAKRGCSGGGVFNTDGELIGILWGGLLFEKISMFEPLLDIKRFLNKVNSLIKL